MMKPRNQIQPAIPFELCPAKTFTAADGRILSGRKILEHSLIVGAVAQALIDRFPINIREKLFPSGAHLVAAAHDIGKVSPYFVEKLRQVLHESNFPERKDIDPAMEKEWGGHAGVSEATAEALGAPRFVPQILGRHHGFSPNLGGRPATSEVFGGIFWHEQRVRLVETLKSKFGADWPRINDHAQANLLSGLVSVADWIGSGHHFSDPSAPWEDRIERALNDAGFVAPAYRKGLSFEDVFGFPDHEPQRVLINAVNGPGVAILEGQMGLGKTEAALYAAYKLLDAGLASGIYFALPTQLTSNKIFDRVNQFLETILDSECKHRSLLLHGNAHLLEATDLGEEGMPGRSWFASAKRGLLAPFAVGTIDQALMAAMNVRHGFVRAFGLAGKVVILDEIHTYDSYTGTIIDALISLLRSLECTVIILSATLTKERRQVLLKCSLSKNDYPLVTSLSSSGALQELTPTQPVNDESVKTVNASDPVAIRHVDDALALDEALHRARQGQQVLWIENTVDEAQARYLTLSAKALALGIDCGLLHSRFTAFDREALEQTWVNLYGKPGWQQRQARGRILVGTQVLEQSIDIDADFLVTRLAPTDMLLQRMGRLWRHAKAPRVSSARREAWILSPALEAAIEQPEQYFGGSAYVYSHYVLCRTLEVWKGISQVRLPEDIRDLIERTYENRQESGVMARWLDHLENGTGRVKGRKALRQLAQVTLSQDGRTLADTEAQTRYSEAPTVDLLIVRNIMKDTHHRRSIITLIDGSTVELPHVRHGLSDSEWRSVTIKLMRQIVKVRPSHLPGKTSIESLKDYGLHHCFYLGNTNTFGSNIHVALMDSRGLLASSGDAENERYLLSYQRDLGYQVSRKRAEIE